MRWPRITISFAWMLDGAVSEGTGVGTACWTARAAGVAASVRLSNEPPCIVGVRIKLVCDESGRESEGVATEAAKATGASFAAKVWRPHQMQASAASGLGS